MVDPLEEIEGRAVTSHLMRGVVGRGVVGLVDRAGLGHTFPELLGMPLGYATQHPGQPTRFQGHLRPEAIEHGNGLESRKIGAELLGHLIDRNLPGVNGHESAGEDTASTDRQVRANESKGSDVHGDA